MDVTVMVRWQGRAVSTMMEDEIDELAKNMGVDDSDGEE